MKNIKIISVILITSIFFTLSLTSSCGIGQKDGIIVAGSTSVSPFAEILADGYMAKYPGYDIDIQQGGSSAGIVAAQTGTANIGMSSRNLKDNELHLNQYEIAKDGLAIIVHPENIINDLTTKQIQDIYAGKITNWKDLGGDDAKIYVVTREEGSGTRAAFDEMLMGKDENGNPNQINPKSIVFNTNNSIRQLVSSGVHFIGYISLGLVEAKEADQKPVKALKIDGVTPTHDSVLSGEYKLSRPYLFVVDGEPSEPVKKFIDYVLSEEGQQILYKEGLVTLMERVE